MSFYASLLPVCMGIYIYYISLSLNISLHLCVSLSIKRADIKFVKMGHSLNVIFNTTYSLELYLCRTRCNFIRWKTNPINVLGHRENLLIPSTLKVAEPFRFLCYNSQPGISWLRTAARCTLDMLDFLERLESSGTSEIKHFPLISSAVPIFLSGTFIAMHI